MARRSSRVMIKIPRVPDDMTDVGAADRLGILAALLRAEADSLGRLATVPGVAKFLDRGKYSHRLQSATKASVFVVQEYVEGTDLTPYLKSQYGDGDRFSGIPDADTFFQWARRLTTTVLEVHKRLVVHGFIWPQNIRVNTQNQPVVVDFAEALFAQVMNDTTRIMDRTGRYMAPERVRSVGGDLFALGGLLFYLAAGEDPPRPYEDIEVLKRQVETTIRSNNPSLVTQNCGVVDVIARCLRYSHRGRVENAAQLLRDIDTFNVQSVSEDVAGEVDRLSARARELDASGHALFKWMAVLQVRELMSHLEGMGRGAYDLTADPDTIRWAAAGLMNTLGQGDEFLALAVPKFWWPANIGINGRFLSTTKEAVRRGVSVRRIFLIDQALTDRYLDQIVAAQQQLAVELGYQANYSVRYVLVNAGEREQLVREGKHFGLFVHRGASTAFFPQYRADDTLESLRFRSDPSIVKGLAELFRRLDHKAVPLADLRLPSSQVG